MFHLGWFIGNGSGVQGWGEKGYPHGYDWTSPAHFQDMARQLERGCIDFILPEDSAMVPDQYGGTSEIYLRDAAFAPKFDPAALVPYIAMATSRIGIIPTLSTVYYPPFLLARLTSTLDHFTKGRLGWNVVTSTSDLGARNYGLDGLPEHDLRYDMADEFLELCTKLWESWDVDAIVADEATGVFADHTKVHRLDFEGKWYRSQGPLNLPRSPQGRPVLAQAGNSGRGREFAAHHAEVIMGQVSGSDAMKAFRNDIHERAAAYGRSPAEIKVLFLASPKIFDTRDEADAYLRSMHSVADHDVIASLARVGAITGVDFSRYPLDEPLPEEITTNGNQSTLASVRSGGATVREIGLRWGHYADPDPMVGTAEEVADHMGELMDAVGGDGFLLVGSLRPRYVIDIVDGLIPALQRRGLVRTEYGHAHLRDNLMEF